MADREHPLVTGSSEQVALTALDPLEHRGERFAAGRSEVGLVRVLGHPHRPAPQPLLVAGSSAWPSASRSSRRSSWISISSPSSAAIGSAVSRARRRGLDQSRSIPSSPRLRGGLRRLGVAALGEPVAHARRAGRGRARRWRPTRRGGGSGRSSGGLRLLRDPGVGPLDQDHDALRQLAGDEVGDRDLLDAPSGSPSAAPPRRTGAARPGPRTRASRGGSSARSPAGPRPRA